MIGAVNVVTLDYLALVRCWSDSRIVAGIIAIVIRIWLLRFVRLLSMVRLTMRPVRLVWRISLACMVLTLAFMMLRFLVTVVVVLLVALWVFVSGRLVIIRIFGAFTVLAMLLLGLTVVVMVFRPFVWLFVVLLLAIMVFDWLMWMLRLSVMVTPTAEPWETRWTGMSFHRLDLRDPFGFGIAMFAILRNVCRGELQPSNAGPKNKIEMHDGMRYIFCCLRLRK